MFPVIEATGQVRLDAPARASMWVLTYRGIEWYSKMLGFEVDVLWPPQDPTFAAFVSQDGAAFSVMEAQPVPSGGRFNFDVNDVDELCKQLKGLVEVVEPLCDTPYGTRKFTIRDLDGNELGFVQA